MQSKKYNVAYSMKVEKLEIQQGFWRHFNLNQQETVKNTIFKFT